MVSAAPSDAPDAADTAAPGPRSINVNPAEACVVAVAAVANGANAARYARDPSDDRGLLGNAAASPLIRRFLIAFVTLAAVLFYLTRKAIVGTLDANTLTTVLPAWFTVIVTLALYAAAPNEPRWRRGTRIGCFILTVLTGAYFWTEPAARLAVAVFAIGNLAVVLADMCEPPRPPATIPGRPAAQTP